MKQLLPLLCLLTVASHAATLNVGTLKSYLDKPVITPSYTPYAAGFSGTAQYERRTSVPTGLSDSSAFTVGFWLDLTGGDSAAKFIMSMYSSASLRFTAQRNATNKISFSAYNSSTTVILSAVGSGTYTASSPAGFTHFLLAVNLADGSLASRHLYTNGVEDAAVSWNTFDTTPGVADFSMTSPDFYIAASSGGGSLLIGSLCDLWFNDTYLNDITKFIAGGSPVSLGASGETPLGTVPVLYFSGTGSGASWNNSASASTFTVTGTPSSPSPPP